MKNNGLVYFEQDKSYLMLGILYQIKFYLF